MRDPDAPCEHYKPTYPERTEHTPSGPIRRVTFTGSCMTDGHYLCLECPEMARQAAIEREFLPLDADDR